MRWIRAIHKPKIVLIFLPCLFLICFNSFASEKEVQSCLAKAGYKKKSNIISHSKLFEIWDSKEDSVLIIDSKIFSYRVSPSFEKCSRVFQLKNKNPRTVILSTSLVPHFKNFEAEKYLIGVEQKNFISSLWARNKDELISLGYPLNLELVKKNQIDLVIGYDLSDQAQELGKKLEMLGVNYINFSDYLESHPLGRVEWAFAFCFLFQCIEKAEEWVKMVSINYENIKKSHAKNSKKAKVLVGSFLGDGFFIPNKNSYLNQIFEDSNAEIVRIKESTKKDGPSEILTLEQLVKLLKNEKIQYYFPHVKDNTWEKLVSTDSRYNQIRKINLLTYNFTKNISQNGGIDFWENGVTRPDVILKDLASIMSGEKFEVDKELTFYEIIK